MFWAVTMIDPAMGWFEIIPIEEKTAVHVMNQVEIAWLTRYPWPCTLTCDQGTEFMKEFAETIREDYGINKTPATMRNPQGNAVLERIHQTLGNMVRTFKLHKETAMTHTEAWLGILASCMSTLRSTYHTTLQAMPM